MPERINLADILSPAPTEEQVGLELARRKKARARHLARARERGYRDEGEFHQPASPTAPENQPPVASDDFFEGVENTNIFGNVIANDVDAESVELTSQLLTEPEHGTLTGGLAANGDFTYTPDADFFGSDSFTYEISDGAGGTDTGTVFLEVFDSSSPSEPPTPEGFTLVEDNTELANAIAAGTTKIALARSGSPFTLANDTAPIANLHFTSQFQDDETNWSMLRFFVGTFFPAPFELIFDRMNLNGTHTVLDPHGGAGAIMPLFAFYDCKVSGGLALMQRLPGSIFEPSTRKIQNLHIKRVTAATPSGGRQFCTYMGILNHIEIEDVTINNYFRGGIDLGNEQGDFNHDQNLDTTVRRVLIDTIRHNPQAAANWCMRLRTTNTLVEDWTGKNLGTGTWAGAPNAGPEHDTEGFYTKVRKNGGPTGLGIDDGTGRRWGLIARRLYLENCGSEQGFLGIKGSGSNGSHSLIEDVTMRAINGHLTAKIWLQCLGPNEFHRVSVEAPDFDGSDARGANNVVQIHSTSVGTYGTNSFINCSSISGPTIVAGGPRSIQGDTNWTGPNPVPPYVEDADATILFAAMSVQPDQATKVLYNDLIKGLKTDGNWDTLDVLYLLAAHDAQAASLNIKAPATFTITLGDAPTFTVDRGYAGDGVDDYIDTTFNPSSSGGSQTQDSVAIYAWSLLDASEAVRSYGEYDGTDGLTLACRTVNSALGARLNQTALTVSANNVSLSGIGFFAGNRSASNAVQLYRNGSAITANSGGTQASVARNNLTLKIGTADLSSFSAFNCAAFALGGSRSSTQHSQIYSRIRTFLLGKGATS